MTTLVEQLARRGIGTIVSVNPKEFHVLLETDAPAATALNAGYPAPFPRINSYVLVPNEIGAIVCLVSWLTIEHAQFPKRTGLKDFGLIDLPYPLRKMSVLPVATLRRSDSDHDQFTVERGVRAFPTVGDTVVLPTKDELRQIVEGRAQHRVLIGSSPLAAGAQIGVDPDRLFGRHFAVLGNTGSGKSCSVAGLIRWAVEAAFAASNLDDSKPPSPPKARFIILDPNGEYAKALENLPCPTRVFSLESGKEGCEQLTLPAWLWNSEEWTAFSRAQPGTQRPILMETLRCLRAGSDAIPKAEREVRRVAMGHAVKYEGWLAQGMPSLGDRDRIACGEKLEMLLADTTNFAGMAALPQPIRDNCSSIQAATDRLLKAKRSPARDGRMFYKEFAQAEITPIKQLLDQLLALVPGTGTVQAETADSPVPFDVSDLPDYLDSVAASEGGGGQFVSFLSMRIRMMLADTRLSDVVCPPVEASLADWLEKHIGGPDGQVTVLDLSLVPSDILHIVVAALGRVVFEALQRIRRDTGTILPTVLVLEEAHTFVHRGRSQSDDNLPSPEQMCRRTFERIAREGRKFGLGLLLASQRPAELSPTVLAQCNTFLLHRIVNDEDQNLVRKLVPDNLGDLLRELPALPTQYAILLGWATPVPVLVEMRPLPQSQRPDSADPRFWDTWCGQQDAALDWKDIADAWQGNAPSEDHKPPAAGFDL